MGSHGDYPVASNFLRISTIDRGHSAHLLAEFRLAHDALVRTMADLDDLTRGPLPSKAQIVEARWRISRASLARRMLWKRVYDHLSRFIVQSSSSDLNRLQEADTALLRASSAHVSRWGIDAVISDWSGYCQASLEIRWKMKACMGAEKRLVYPMLQADHW